MANLIIYRATNGLNTKIDPARLRYDPKGGIRDLAVAYNVDGDDTGRIGRRKGYEKKISASMHSLFCDGGECLFVTGDALCVLHSDYTYTAIRNVKLGARMSYVQVNNEIYYSNGYEKGVVRGGISYAWQKGTYKGPETQRQFSDPPVGSLLGYFNGRIYVVQGPVVWYSEPFWFGGFDLTDNFYNFASDIKMIRAVTDGLYISNEKETFFCAGLTPKEAEVRRIAEFPVIKWTDVSFNGRLFFTAEGDPSIDMGAPEKSALWLSEKGICYGGPGGQFYNLTERKLADLPKGHTGSALVFNGKYIGLINP